MAADGAFRTEGIGVYPIVLPGSGNSLLSVYPDVSLKMARQARDGAGNFCLQESPPVERNKAEKVEAERGELA